MKKRLKQSVCLLISTMLIIGSLPIGVLAEELNQPTQPTRTESVDNLIEKAFEPTETETPASPEAEVPETEPIAPDTDQNVPEEEPVLTPPEVNRSMNKSESLAASETMETMATSGDYDYDVIDGVATITKYSGSDPTVSIPANLATYKVVAIGAGAFNGNTDVQKIIVPMTVTTIASGDVTASYTFGSCSSLTEVVIPTSVKTIDAYAFNDTSGVKISGYKDSQAEKYAFEHGITFNTLSFGATLTASLPSGQNINTDITLTAAATGGTGSLSYRFSYDLVKLDGTRVPGNTIQDWSTVSTAPFTLSEAGVYTFYVEVEDGANVTCNTIIDSYKVINQPLVDFNSSVSSPQYINIPIKFTATVTGGTGPFSYEFYHTIGTQTIVDKTEASTSATSMNWETTGLTESGIYTFYVKVKDDQGLETIKKITDYKIYDYLKVDDFKVDKASPQEFGTELKLTATASGGKTESEYKFSYTVDGTTEVIQDYSDQSSITFTPPKTGTYTFTVAVTNAYGVVKSLEVTGYIIQDTPEIGNFTAAKDDGSFFYLGDSDGVILNAEAASGGTGAYTYKYFYQIGTDAKTEITAADSTKNSYAFFPLTAGTYTFFVEVSDVNNLTAKRQVSNYVVYPELEGTLTFDTPQNREATVKFTANASGGKSTYKYQFFYKLKTETDDQYIPMSSEPTSTKTMSKFFGEHGDYEIKVEITDSNGVQTTIEEDLTINNNPLISDFKTTGDVFYVGTPIDIIAEVDPVIASSTLILTGKIGSSLITIPNSEITTVATTNTFTFTPTTAGTYTFTVTLKNPDGTIADTKTMSSIKVLAAPSAKAVKVSKTSGVLLGDVVKLTASGTGGKAAYQYKFYVKKPSDISPIAINTTFATAKTINYPMTEVGEHIFYVEIMDANNQPSGNIDESASVPVKVTNPAVISDFNADKVKTDPADTAVVYQKDSVQLSAKLENAKGDGDLSCVFSYKQGRSWVKIGDTVNVAGTGTNRVALASAKFVPPMAGSYTLMVEVTDQQGTKVTKKITSYKVLSLGTAKAVKLSKTTGLLLGSTIKLTASASGGKTPYTYDYYVTGPDGVETAIVSTKDKTTSYQLNEVGNYTFSVKVTDLNGIVLADTVDTISQTAAVTNPPDLKPLTVEKDQSVGSHTATPVAYENDTLIITAEKNGSTGFQDITYVFEAKQGRTIVDKQEQTNNGVFEFDKTKPGSYTFTITATDSIGSKDVVKKSSYKVLSDVTTKSIKANKTTDLIVGDIIKLTAAGSGGKTPYTYEFYYYLDGGTVPQAVPSSNPKSKTVTFAMPTKGNYKFHVIVTDANGVKCTNYDNQDVSAIATVGNPPVIESLTPSKAKGSAVYPGDAVILTAKVKSGTGLIDPEFDFYYMQGSNRVTIPITTPSTTADPYTAAATFTPTLTGSYNICVDVFDGTNTATYKISGYKVLQGLAVKSFKTDKLSGVNIGTTVKLTAAATGGKSPYSYEFYYYYQDETTPQTIKAYSTSKTVNFIPQQPGFYSLHVRVKDATGRVCTEDYEGSILDFEVVDHPVVKSFTANLPSGQYVETPIELTAAVVGGKTPYTYTFSYQLNGGAVTPIESTDNKAVFTPTLSGTYTFIVTVQDDNGSPQAKSKIEKYMVYAVPSLKTFTVAKDTIVLGSSVSLRATAEGGLKPYKYKFTYSKDGGVEQTIRDYSTTSAIYYVPKETGTYTVKVYLQDKNGREAEQEGDKTITVS